jgi:hypothetical protein
MPAPHSPYQLPLQLLVLSATRFVPPKQAFTTTPHIVLLHIGPTT